MSELTVADYLKYANLQMAAEAFLVDESTGLLKTGQQLLDALLLGNNYASRFTAAQAADFLDQWEVVAQCPNTKTGFSGTLFRNKANPTELVLSFRSTEFVLDAIRDSAATNTLEINATGWAWGQIADMEAWFDELNADPNLLQGKSFSVTGYSLGGHLATAFNLLRQEEQAAGPLQATLANVVTFNGAGVGQVNTGSIIVSGEVQAGRNDVLYDSAGDDRIDGGADADLAIGGEGQDTIYGGAGNDRLYADELVDLDTAVAQGRTGEGTGTGETLDGGLGDDIVIGGTGNDMLSGGGGVDVIVGGAGDDADLIFGGAGRDLITAGSGADLVQGGEGTDIVSGGDDWLNGGLDDDRRTAIPAGGSYLSPAPQGFPSVTKNSRQRRCAANDEQRSAA